MARESRDELSRRADARAPATAAPPGVGGATGGEDPLDVALDTARALDHALARARGEHVRDLVNEILALLVAANIVDVRKVEDARVAMFHTVCEALYGNLAVDIPPLRAARSRL